MSMQSDNARLFINYRRDDSAPYAGRLYDHLTAHFGMERVFMDIDHIEPGEDFVEVITRKVNECDAAVVIIGPNWANASDDAGMRRLDDPEDFVRLEIVAALHRRIRVIPVLVGDATMPQRRELPDALAQLSRRNAIELSETRFHSDVDRLIRALERPSSQPAIPPASPSPASEQKSETPTPPATPSPVYEQKPEIATAPESPSPAPEQEPGIGSPSPSPTPEAEQEPEIFSSPESPSSASEQEPEIASPPEPPSRPFDGSGISSPIHSRDDARASNATNTERWVACGILFIIGIIVVVVSQANRPSSYRSQEYRSTEYSQRTSDSAARETSPATTATPMPITIPRDSARPSTANSDEDRVILPNQTGGLYGNKLGGANDSGADATSLMSTEKMLGDFKTSMRKLNPYFEEELTRSLDRQTRTGAADAQFLMGVSYELGLGQKQDPKTALKWYQLAAKQGHAEAQQALELPRSASLREMGRILRLMKLMRFMSAEGNSHLNEETIRHLKL